MGSVEMKYTSDEIQPAEAVSDAPVAAASVKPIGLQAYSSLQMHFLARLERLDTVRREMASVPDVDPFMKKLVERGLFATYGECMDEGVGVEARHILKI
jgi:hypothetical protein